MMKDARKEFWESEKIIAEFSEKKPSFYITKVLDNLIKNRKIKKALDIGCGAGRYSSYLAKKGLDVIAIDRHEKLVTPILCKKNIIFFKSEMEKLPVQTSEFDLILSVGVLHNATSLIELERSIQEMARVLKRRGIVVCSIFTNDIISNDLVKMNEEYMFLVNGQLPMLLISKRDIKIILEKNKLTNIQTIDEHITNVGSGDRYVYTFLCEKE